VTGKREADGHRVAVVSGANRGIGLEVVRQLADFRVVQEALETNVVGAWRLAAALVPLMHEGRYGRIVNVSSEAGSLASMTASAPAYAVSKAALNAVTRVLAAELRGTGILVNSVCPGWVATDMGRSRGPAGGTGRGGYRLGGDVAEEWTYGRVLPGRHSTAVVVRLIRSGAAPVRRGSAPDR
jgi:NAD(P)-dependent dehydrogenase (short-subunit alcohol dehydrogenase family)